MILLCACACLPLSANGLQSIVAISSFKSCTKLMKTCCYVALRDIRGIHRTDAGVVTCSSSVLKEQAASTRALSSTALKPVFFGADIMHSGLAVYCDKFATSVDASTRAITCLSVCFLTCKRLSILLRIKENILGAPACV